MAQRPTAEVVAGLVVAVNAGIEYITGDGNGLRRQGGGPGSVGRALSHVVLAPGRAWRHPDFAAPDHRQDNPDRAFMIGDYLVYYRKTGGISCEWPHKFDKILKLMHIVSNSSGRTAQHKSTRILPRRSPRDWSSRGATRPPKHRSEAPP